MLPPPQSGKTFTIKRRFGRRPPPATQSSLLLQTNYGIHLIDEVIILTCRLPSFNAEFTASTPLTRIRDIAHRSDIPHELKQEIKHTIQVALRRPCILT